MEKILEQIFVYLTQLSSGVAYFIILAILIACGLGLPLPEDIPLVAAGYLIWQGTLEWTPTLLVTLIGVLGGDCILFYLGQRIGIQILEKDRMQSIFSPAKVRRTRAYFRKYGDRLIFFARFVAGFRAIVFFMAGALKVKFRRFFLLDGIASLISVPLWVLMGYGLGHFFGAEIERIFTGLKEVKMIALIIIVVVGLAFMIRAYVNYSATKETKQKLQATRHRARKKTS